MSDNTNNFNTTELLSNTLKMLGCQAKVDENYSNDIITSYKGEKFTVSFNDNCAFINVWDFDWYEQPLNDVEAVANLKSTINTVNINCMGKLFYTIEDGKLIVNGKRHALFVDEIENIDQYLSSVFDSLLDLHYALGHVLEQKNAESEKVEA